MSGRRDWAQADLLCLLCGRSLGRLVGPVPAGVQGRQLRWGIRQFAAFRPADPSLPAMRLQGTEHFRCTACGGDPIVDEVDFFTTFDEVFDDPEENARPRRGRPPKRFRPLPDSRLRELGLAG